jgi:hypothetical protein
MARGRREFGMSRYTPARSQSEIPILLANPLASTVLFSTGYTLFEFYEPQVQALRTMIASDSARCAVRGRTPTSAPTGMPLVPTAPVSHRRDTVQR